MNRVLATMSLSLLLLSPVYAQVRDNVGDVTVSSIKKLGKSKATNNKSYIEITLTGGPFYVGNWYYCFRIGKLQPTPTGIVNVYTLRGAIEQADWKKLKDGDPMWVSWGCHEPSYYEARKPFAYLNKKMLSKR